MRRRWSADWIWCRSTSNAAETTACRLIPNGENIAACRASTRGTNFQKPSIRYRLKLFERFTSEFNDLASDYAIKTILLCSRSPNDIDIYTGGLAEMPVKGGIIGPLLTCLIGDQFVRVKKGDSFWYERTQGPQKFTAGKIKMFLSKNSPDKSKTKKYFPQLNFIKSSTHLCRQSSAGTRITWSTRSAML